MTTVNSSIDRHPDLMAMRAKYERAAHSPVVQGTLGLTALSGVYLAISPWVVGFDGSSRLGVINLICGVAAAVIALTVGSALDRTHGMTWTLPVIGAWSIAALWAHDGAAPTAGMIWSNAWAGGVITALGLAAVLFGMRPQSTPGR